MEYRVLVDLSARLGLWRREGSAAVECKENHKEKTKEKYLLEVKFGEYKYMI